MYSLWSEQITTLINSDISRIGAQVINGIGFLGAGTIIITGNQQVKGMTTAAGLWASACMGLAIGAGFYAGALTACILIILTTAIFSKLEAFILSHSRNINLYVEFERADDLTKITERLRAKNVRIYDVEFVKAKQADNKYPSAIFALQLPKKTSPAPLQSFCPAPLTCGPTPTSSKITTGLHSEAEVSLDFLVYYINRII
jgi:putative Mg2+ transporter-C (MgtC) family protein